jgi:hypothetical protein
MRRIELEAAGLEAVSRVEKGLGIEDARIEAKAEWLNDRFKAARRIAGHANASGGEPVIWLVGLDEKRGVVGADPGELKGWWEGVRGWFEGGVWPELLLDLAIPLPEGVLVALAFATDRAPYLVRNPHHGQKEGGAVQWEVPWREATAVRTATRRDLIRLLEPQTRRPAADVLDAAVWVTRGYNETTLEWFFEWHAAIRIYLVLPVTAMAFPRHLARLDCLFDLSPRSITIPIGSFGPLLGSGTSVSRNGIPINSRRMEVSPDDVLLHGSGAIELRGGEQSDEFALPECMRLRVQLGFVPGGGELVRQATLTCLGSTDSEETQWVLLRHQPYPLPEMRGRGEEQR